MKEGWTYKKLGEVCEILDSMRKPITKDKRESGEIPYYGATGCLDYVKDYIFDEKLVLLGEDGAKWGAGDNSAYIINGKTWVNNHAHALRPKRNIMIDELLVYYLNFSNLQPFITGVTVPKLNQEKMRSIEIPVPPLSEQRAIVARLDSAFAQIDALKANAERQLAEARKLFQKALEEAMTPKEGWEEKTLKDLVDDLCPISYGIVQQGDNIEKGVPVVRPVDLSKKFITRQGLKCTSDSISNAYKRTILRGNEILLSVRGTTGVLALATAELSGCNVNRGIVPLFFKDIVVRDFLYYEMISPVLQKVFEEKTTGSTLKQINIKDLRLIKLYYPSLATQHSIVAHLDSLSSHVRALEDVLQRTKAECDALKQAMLRAVFE